MESEDVDRNVLSIWEATIKRELPELKDPAFKKYNVTASTYFDARNNEYVVSCSVDVIKNYESYVKLPYHYIISNNVWKLDEELSKLSADLSRQITNQNYIEINGIKYYPKDGDNND